jgi:hypothetical protein
MNFILSCNVVMINALLALGLAFISPIAAFIILKASDDLRKLIANKLCSITDCIARAPFNK